MQLIKAVRGTKDIIGEDALKYNYISDISKQVFESYGCQFIKTPIFEETDLFKRGIGEATDVVEKEMYTFKDRGDRSITLRPENTASVVRSYLENAIYAKEDVSRFYYNGSMFRYERPQAGRQREFNQIGVEVLGEKSPILDAEIIAMGYKLLQKLGITDLEVRINCIGSNASRTEYRKKLLEYFKPMKEELCEDCKNRLERNPLRVLDCKIDHAKMEDAPSIIDSLFEEERAHYEAVKKYLTIFGIPFVEDPGLVRGLDYYSSTVFEIVTNKLGSQGTVLGGGRYDNLLKQLGDKDIPAFGFASGVERIMMLLEEYPKKSTDVYLAWLGENTLEKAMEITALLRENNIKVSVDYHSKGMKSHMKKADKLNTKYCIILGEDELAKNVVILKNFETREQEEISMENIVRAIKGGK
ncbi:histidine--tRNA ligase [Fusobacterium necrophorum subsp. funduliforme ATCC 51357]|uniref:Histidine--tRNA ligase n=1 Tax=Fusobacterium necrophorum subsp. funduliforme TaxID=143387 RepID=A0A162JGS5_9FUSO|nr:histidine--tRNA ligase [Fusobacterium necrophorum]AYV93278.1 histidine--tRNA ligase [Fusobacterium necrophorum subsp. funduliforme]EIJ71284.1 histidine--tRNA ligase [Fusobacterium necrophorum subsp. funduliforme ATCC 51357]KAB0554421.1 histidine--tRNA ligase [Fusobacterium necrophorum subsp. funduliforme]KDE62448.1 histidyl-tRNA synthetase [Fusobacterium necrophorum BFTR-1]KYL05731.1 histidine--tRNA ligase [Fusobacterium necrophorum subsp. funduliforme]